jgi:hypothetical protein
MRVLASAVLVMESFSIGFALLIAMKDVNGAPIIYGAIVAIALLLAPGLLKRRVGWVVGWILQVAMLGFGLVVNSFLIIGLIFAGLWIAAILVGRKGEAARAALLALRPPDA